MPTSAWNSKVFVTPVFSVDSSRVDRHLHRTVSMFSEQYFLRYSSFFEIYKYVIEDRRCVWKWFKIQGEFPHPKLLIKYFQKQVFIKWWKWEIWKYFTEFHMQIMFFKIHYQFHHSLKNYLNYVRETEIN